MKMRGFSTPTRPAQGRHGEAWQSWLWVGWHPLPGMAWVPPRPPDVKRGGCSGTKCESLELTHAPAQGPRACHKAPRLQEAAQWGKRPQVQATVRCSSRDRAGPQGPQERLPQDGASGSEWSLLGDGEGTWYWRPKESQRAAGPLLGKGAATTGEKAKTPLT